MYCSLYTCATFLCDLYLHVSAIECHKRNERKSNLSIAAYDISDTYILRNLTAHNQIDALNISEI